MVDSRSKTEVPVPSIQAQDAAALLGVSVKTVWDMCRRGEIPAAKVGRRWYVNRAKLLEKMGVDA